MGAISEDAIAWLEKEVAGHQYDTLHQPGSDASEQIANRVQMIAPRLLRLLQTRDERLVAERVQCFESKWLPGDDLASAVVVPLHMPPFELANVLRGRFSRNVLAVVAFINGNDHSKNSIGLILPYHPDAAGGQSVGHMLVRLSRQGVVTIWRCGATAFTRRPLEIVLYEQDPFDVMISEPVVITTDQLSATVLLMIRSLADWLPEFCQDLDALTGHLLHEEATV